MITKSEHIRSWLYCGRCQLYKTRQRTCLFRANVVDLPFTDILFIGEAPGDSEDILGKPFTGPAGKMLTALINEAQQPNSFTYTLTNIVACKPPGSDPVFGGSTRRPSSGEISACKPRLIELYELCNRPKVITVGKQAKDNLTTEIPQVASIIHPAFIIKQTEFQRQTLFHKNVSIIRWTVHKLL